MKRNKEKQVEKSDWLFSLYENTENFIKEQNKSTIIDEIGHSGYDNHNEKK